MRKNGPPITYPGMGVNLAVVEGGAHGASATLRALSFRHDAGLESLHGAHPLAGVHGSASRPVQIARLV